MIIRIIFLSDSSEQEIKLIAQAKGNPLVCTKSEDYIHLPGVGADIPAERQFATSGHSIGLDVPKVGCMFQFHR
jgi:hypothetical protein